MPHAIAHHRCALSERPAPASIHDSHAENASSFVSPSIVLEVDP